MKIVLEPDPRFRYAADRVAARVTSAGVDYQPEKRVFNADQAMPFKVKRITQAMSSSQNFTDLTGVRFGRFTVYGLASGANGRWACRCDCGRHALRSKKAIMNPDNDCDRCEHCRHFAALKRSEEWRMTGRHKVWL